jgi:hypothetical protein
MFPRLCRHVLPLLGVLLSALGAPNLLANGGTFDTSKVHRTGNLEPVTKAKISLVKEDLRIVLKGEYALVSVEYTLQNNGGADKVTYGFPVDMAAEAFPSAGEDLQFTVKDDSTAVPLDQVIRKDSPIKPAETSFMDSEYIHIIREWNLMTLSFRKGETKTLRVLYSVKNLGHSTGTSKETVWSESPRTFIYALSPSQSWGNGKVGSLTIEVDASDLQERRVPIESISLPGYHQDGSKYVWQFTDYDLKKAPDLLIRYDSTIRQRDAEVQALRLPSKAIASIKASSTRAPSQTTNATYGVNNLLDGDFHTAWIEGKDDTGQGETLEITFRKGTAVKFIAIANGYWKSAEHLKENGWIKKLRVQCLYANGEKTDDEFELSAPVLDNTSIQFPYAAAELFDDSGEGRPPAIRSMKLTIIDAEKGTKYSDTAISELILGGKFSSGE